MSKDRKFESVLPALVQSLIGTKTSTTSTGAGAGVDTDPLRQIFGEQMRSSSPEGMAAMLSELFTTGAKQVPVLTQAFANSAGARTTGNSGLNLSLAELNKTLAGQAATLAIEQQAKAAQTAGGIAQATRGSAQTNETKKTGMGDPTTALLGSLLGTGLNFADKKGAFKGIFGNKDIAGAPMDFSNALASNTSSLATAGFTDDYSFMNNPAASSDLGGMSVGDLDLSNFADLATTGAGELAGSVGDIDLSNFNLGGVEEPIAEAAGAGSDFIDFGEFFADGGLVNAKSLRSKHQLMQSRMSNKPKGYADGGMVDARGRRTTSTDTRVSDQARAEEPAYGFNGLTIGEITALAKELKVAKQDSKSGARGYADGGMIAEDDITDVTPIIRNRNNMGDPATRMGTSAINFDASASSSRALGGPTSDSPRQSSSSSLAKILERNRTLQPSEGEGASGNNADFGTSGISDATGGASALLGSLLGAIAGPVGMLAGKAMGLGSLQGAAAKAMASQALNAAGFGGSDGTAGFGSSSESGFAGSNAGGSGLGFNGDGNSLSDGPAGTDGALAGDGFDSGATGGVGGGYGGTAGSGDMGGGMSGGDNGGGIGGGDYANGGEIQGRGTGTSDSIPARLSDGEFVISADVVEALGADFFEKLQDQFHVPAAMQRRAA